MWIRLRLHAVFVPGRADALDNLCGGDAHPAWWCSSRWRGAAPVWRCSSSRYGEAAPHWQCSIRFFLDASMWVRTVRSMHRRLLSCRPLPL
uniref:Uncharacterized protein n=1 Tax=Arundo donax TaxID=35708 RepID=A0A0A8Z734_ARUDO